MYYYAAICKQRKPDRLEHARFVPSSRIILRMTLYDIEIITLVCFDIVIIT